MDLTSLLETAEVFVEDLLRTKLPENMFFHNLQHTRRVVDAAVEIGMNEGLSRNEIKVVQLAAWFHDTGYCYAYNGHEEKSIDIASDFLTAHKCDVKVISKVVEIIGATKMPQQPTKVLEQIICDADLYHLSLNTYWDLSLKLQNEWQLCLDINYTDTEWRQSSLNFLITHQYFTPYGKTVLQPRKLNNIDELLKEL